MRSVDSGANVVRLHSADKVRVQNRYRFIKNQFAMDRPRYGYSSPAHLEEWTHRPALLDENETEMMLEGLSASEVVDLLRQINEVLKDIGELRLTATLATNPQSYRPLITLNLYRGE